MRIIIAPDSFKGSLTSRQASETMALGVRRVLPSAQLELCPLADGGEGTVEVLVNAGQGRYFETVALDPLGRNICATWGFIPHQYTAIVEMAAASGLPRLKADELNPLRTTSFGTGQLIAAALEILHSQKVSPGVRPTLIIGIGGSASNDAGVGLLQALGVSFKDQSGKELGFGGGELKKLNFISLEGLNPLLAATDIYIASDVNNPLFGVKGASAVFGPQKGATPEMVDELDQALQHFAMHARQATGRDCAGKQGAGAAGGLGAGLLFFTDAKLVSGIELVMNLSGFTESIKEADLVLTGEGCTDGQTAYGKVPAGVARAAQQYGVPVVCISGALGDGIENLYQTGITALFDAVPRPLHLEDCVKDAEKNLSAATEQVFRVLILGGKLRW